MAKKFTTKISVKGSRASTKNGFSFFGKGKSSESGYATPGSRRPRKDTRSGIYKNFASWSNPLGTGSKRLVGKAAGGKKFGGKFTKKKLLKVAYIGFASMMVIGFVGLIGLLIYMQSLTKDLPDPEKPFQNEKFQAESSIIYDRNGKELYRLFDQDGANRNIIKLEGDQTFDETIPPELKWSLLAAEDIDFYEHPGFDVKGILRCGLRYASSGSANCGGSTITQQVVKIASLEDNTRSIERKLKELVLALQLERTIDNKDEILLLYMNIAPEGGNIYGVQTASEYYFGKDVKDLTLEEAVVLAAVPNNPAYLSPTRSADPELGAQLLEERQNIIYNNLLKYKDKINKEVKKSREEQAKKEGRELTDEEKEDFITEERVAEAREKELVYQDADDDILAPHFVFFAKEELTTREYNDGEVFTENQINTGGYKIYTTLDYDIQQVALDVVQNVGVGQYGVRYGNKNAALMTMTPENGEIIAMVGSKCYNNAEKADCSKLDEEEGKLFDSKVNILTTDQQPGSSIKPLVYYLGFKEGIIAPASQLADIPIEIGSYKPKNSDGGFSGIHDVRYHLSQSRNIPAVVTLTSVGPEKLADVKKDIGYTRNLDPSTYGPAAALGSQDVYAVEHANAYATFANGGNFVKYQAILRIEDKNGNVIFDIEGKDKPQSKRVLDERAVFLTNDATNPNSRTGSLSPVKWRGRDMSGKTGTSENNRDTWFVNYSPDFVTVGWSGNNDNTRMAGGAFGSTNTEPWVREFMNRVGESKYFKAKTPYTRPGGITTGNICSEIEVNGKKQKVCEGGNDYKIEGINPPAYVSKQTALVCTDQPDKLARPIDEATGNAEKREFIYAKMPVSSLQTYLDKYLEKEQGANGIPKEECTVNRSPNGSSPWAEINTPTAGGNYTGTISANINGYTPNGSVKKMEFYLGSTQIGSTSKSTFTGSLSIPGGTYTGLYAFRVVVTDSANKVGESSVSVNIDGVDPGLSITAPGNGTSKPVNVGINVVASHNGLSGIHLYAQKNGGSTIDVGEMSGGGGTVSTTWTPTETGTYTLWVKTTTGFTAQSGTITVNVI